MQPLGWRTYGSASRSWGWLTLPRLAWSKHSRRMTMVGLLRGVPVVDENSRPVELARLEVLQRLLCS